MDFKKTFELKNSMIDLSDKSQRLYLIIIALMIFFAYLPTLQYDFAPGDQWRAFQYNLFDDSALTKAHKCFSSRISHDLKTGRPFCAIGEYIEHPFVGKISDFSTTRPIVLIFVIFTAFCIGLALSPSVGGIANGTAIGALFVLSPGYAFMYYRGLSAIMILIALILAILSYIFLRQTISEDFHKNKLLLSSVFFLTACLIYPAWAFVVFIFTLTDFLFCINSERLTRLKHLLIKVFFFTAISIMYYLIIKFIIIFLPADNTGSYEFSANFNPVYLSIRFFLAFVNFMAQPPLNTLYNSLFVLNFIFLSSVIFICSFLFFKKNDCKGIKTYCSFSFIIFICVFLISVSIAPWLLSKMPTPGNRFFISFSLLMCALIGWGIFRVSTKLFPTRKYISTILIIFIILLPAAAIQNKRTAIEVGISGTEIEAMRLVVHKWIDENSFTKKRYVVVVKPKRPRPLFYDRVLNNVIGGGPQRFSDDPLSYLKEVPHSYLKDDPLYFYKKGLDDMNRWRHDYTRSSIDVIKYMYSLLYAVAFLDSLEFTGDPGYYFQMFTALIREDCDRQHPFSLMNVHDLSFAREKAEKTLGDSPLNIVFTVVNQGEQVKTNHEILEINFSLITNLPEPLIVDQAKDEVK
jgi:hypothetical protein